MKAVIFDLDGVLVDSEPLWQEAFATAANQWCLAHGHRDPMLSARQMRRFHGGRANDTMRRVLTSLGYGDELSAAELEAVTAAVVARAADQFRAAPQPLEASVGVVRSVAESGIPVAVASASALTFIDTVLEVTGLAEVVKVRESALGLPADRGKPHPEVYARCLARLGQRPSDVLAVEDSTNGVISALRAGLRVVWLLDDAVAVRHEPDDVAIRRLAGELRRLGLEPTLADGVDHITRRLTLADLSQGASA